MMDELNPDETKNRPPDSQPAPAPGDAPAPGLAQAPELLQSPALLQGFEALLAERAPGDAAPMPAGTDAEPAADPGPCPEPGAWLRLAGAELAQANPAETSVLLAHAALCGACAARLRQCLRLLDEKPSPEESAEIAKLASSQQDWQKRLAVRLARTPSRSVRGKALNRYVWAGAGLAAALLLVAGLSLWWQREHTPERLLAETYARTRIFDLRMPGAGFSEVTPATHLRGGTTGREASKLLDARARIEQRLETKPDDPYWLQLEARADLMEENFDAAIDILDRLVAAGPVTSSLLADDAAAYFQRGAATGSQNDRATALEYLRRADELNPADTLVLFNEAVVMEDRGQMMNAVETWNRYLRFERDPRWLAEGRKRLESLEQKLNQLKSHQGRMERHLASPQAMLQLAADPAMLAALDEELSSTLLPRLLLPAFPLPVDRSRGSPCDQRCLAARTLLDALAVSLVRNHQDPWLTQLLPPNSTPPSDRFPEAVQTLAQAIAADAAGDFANGEQGALKAGQLFHNLGNAAGEDRAVAEQAYALQMLSDTAGCYKVAHSLLGRNPRFAWIQIQDFTEDSVCDPTPGTTAEEYPGFVSAMGQARDHHYSLLEMRARNWLGAPAVDTGDVENAWRIYLGTVHLFWSGDYPAYRLYTTLSGLEELEESTPRVHHALLLQQEAVETLELSQNRGLIPAERLHLAAAAIRAGAISEAQRQMQIAQDGLAASGGGNSIRAFLVENENAMANLYLDRGDTASAAKMLQAAHGHMAQETNTFHQREYAAARGRLELALGHVETAEKLLRAALIEEERLAVKGGTAAVPLAQQDRDLYAVLAGVWLAQGRGGPQVLALWERYRLRVLGRPVAACPNKGLACLQPALAQALVRLGQDRLLGQIVLFDRVLTYQASAGGVDFAPVPVSKQNLLDAAESLERAASSPATSQGSVDQAARRVGDILLGGLDEPENPSAGQLLLEPDPLLGNLPWPAIATAAGPIGLRFDLEEAPSLLLNTQAGAASRLSGSPLVVGASVASGQTGALPEVLEEARAVARFEKTPNVLLATQATEPQIAARLGSAPAIHFAGHAARQDGATRLLLAPAATNPAVSGPGKPYLDSDLFRRHPPRSAQLAVFSACSTGKKEEGWNHGMGDVVDTLAALGVPQVVATRWEIDSSSAVPMMSAFYGGLAEGLTVPRALTEARQSLVRDARYRHPYYWAAWYASGSGQSNLSAVFRAAR
jgi:CHAT domain-containing protein